MNSDVKLDSQIRSEVHIFSSKAVVIRAFISSWLDYCNSLYVSQPVISEPSVGEELGGEKETTSYLFWPTAHFRLHFKIWLFVFTFLNGLALPFLSELVHHFTQVS